MLVQHGSCSVSSKVPTVHASHSIDEFVCRTVGLRVREQDIEALTRWTEERVRTLALPGIEQYGALLVEDSETGHREREMLTVQFTTGESYFFLSLIHILTLPTIYSV